MEAHDCHWLKLQGATWDVLKGPMWLQSCRLTVAGLRCSLSLWNSPYFLTGVFEMWAVPASQALLMFHRNPENPPLWNLAIDQSPRHYLLVCEHVFLCPEWMEERQAKAFRAQQSYLSMTTWQRSSCQFQLRRSLNIVLLLWNETGSVLWSLVFRWSLTPQ